MTLQFLYPTSRLFPFDAVCSQLVASLEKRNWQVPGITVKTSDYGSGEQKMRYVSHIKGDDFSLHFCRSQQLLPGGRWNDIAAVCDLTIPQKILHVYEDESGPVLWVYAGDDWHRDRALFLPVYATGFEPKPPAYHMYKGTTYRSRSPYLQAQNVPYGESPPPSLPTAYIMEEFRDYLHVVVLPRIEAHPVAETLIDVLAMPEKIAFPENLGPFYTCADHQAARRIKDGPALLEPAERYAVHTRYRLASLDVRNDGTLLPIAYDSFVWCGLDLPEVLRHGPPGDVAGYDDKYILKVMPKHANDVYIADHGAYEKRRTELAALVHGRSRFTNEEVADISRARARTIVPITEYKGGFTHPVLLVNRELLFDEVEIIREPQPGGR